MLGVEIGEEFKVKGDNELTYRFTNNGLKLTHDSDIELAKIAANVAFVDLVNGKDEIVKLPWKPRKGETYYTFELLSGKWVVNQLWWAGSPYGYAILDKGWLFRTKEEAEDALPKVAAEMGVEYKL